MSPSLKPKLGRKKTKKNLDSHTTKTKQILSQGLQGCTLSCTPFCGGWVGTKEKEGRQGWACEEGGWLLGLTGCGLSLSAKPASLCRVLHKGKPPDKSHGAVPSSIGGAQSRRISSELRQQGRECFPEP